jgi:hypothetical protein
MKVDSETERNGRPHDHDDEINLYLRRDGAADLENGDDEWRVNTGPAEPLFDK